jgi:hypothetical protein
MNRRNLCLGSATGIVALLAILFVMWQRTHAGPLCPFHQSGYDRLVGMTGEQVEQRLGKPDSIGGATLLGEREVWEYDTIHREPGAARPTPLFVHFDAQARVCRICTFDGRKIE